jgi:hypothetical protein
MNSTTDEALPHGSRATFEQAASPAAGALPGYRKR